MASTELPVGKGSRGTAIPHRVSTDNDLHGYKRQPREQTARPAPDRKFGPSPTKDDSGPGGSAQSIWETSKAAITLMLVGLFLFLYIGHSFFGQLNGEGCAMAYMRPVFLKLDEFAPDGALQDKYRLYLYREAGIDQNRKLRGVPALFIPGNAGSHKQARSLAAQSAQYFNRHQLNGPIDFFSVDFAEDLTAFHGQTLVDQATYVNEAISYILSMYRDPNWVHRNEDFALPEAVILIGHSMGGIVARTTFTLPNFKSGSVNTLVTLATPHSRAPVSFDAEMVSVYKKVNQFWREGFEQSQPLKNVSVVSIAGGIRDSTVPSDYSSLSDIVPASNRLCVHTIAIPDVWTNMDHLAITWCDQLRKTIVKALYEILDVRSPAGTIAADKRMDVFVRQLSPIALEEYGSDYEEQIESAGTVGEEFRLSPDGYRLFPVNGKDRAVFELLVEGDITASACRKVTLDDEDLLACRSLASPVRLPGPHSTMQYYRTLASWIEGYHLIAVGEGDVVAAGWSPLEKPLNIGGTMRNLVRGEFEAHSPPGHSVLRTVKVNSEWSSLLAYSVGLDSDVDFDLDSAIVRFVTPHESAFLHHGKYRSGIRLHSSAPYMKVPGGRKVGGFKLQVWAPAETDVRIKVFIDIGATVGQLWMRYRTLLAVLPLSIACLAVRRQLRSLQRGVSISFPFALGEIAMGEIPIFVVILSGLHFILGVLEQIQDVIPPSLSIVGSLMGMAVERRHGWLLGTDDPLSAILLPMFVLVSFSVCAIFAFVVLSVISCLSWITVFVRTRSPVWLRIPLGSGWPSFRLVMGAGAAVVVPRIVPYLLVYAIFCAVQFMICVISLPSKRSFNVSFSILMLVLWLVPSNIPVLVVWARNVSMGVSAPFPTHHSAFSVLPSVVIAELDRIDGLFPALKSGLEIRPVAVLLDLALTLTAYATVVIGVDRAYILHDIVALFCGAVCLACVGGGIRRSRKWSGRIA